MPRVSGHVGRSKRAKILTGQHVGVGTIANGKDVGWHLSTPLALVQLNDTGRVDGVALVRIDGHAEEARVGLR